MKSNWKASGRLLLRVLLALLHYLVGSASMMILRVYEFPVTRKIIIEADPTIPESEIIAMAKRCHDKEIGLEIMGGGYQLSLSPANVRVSAPARKEGV